MNLQKYKEEVQWQFDSIGLVMTNTQNQKVRNLIDFTLSSFLEAVEKEVVPQSKGTNIGGQMEETVNMAYNTCRAKVIEAFTRIKGKNV